MCVSVDSVVDIEAATHLWTDSVKVPIQ